jgi:hypothetical protein
LLSQPCIAKHSELCTDCLCCGESGWFAAKCRWELLTPLVIVCSHTAGGCVLDSGRGHQRNHAPGLLHVGSDEDSLNLPHCSVVLFSRTWECACAMEQDDRSVSTDDVGDCGPTTLGIVDIVAVAKCYVLPLHFVFLLQSRLGGCPHGPEGADWFAAEALPRGSSGVRGDGGGAPCIGSMAFEMLGELAGCPVTSSRVLTCTSLGRGTCIVAH